MGVPCHQGYATDTMTGRTQTNSNADVGSPLWQCLDHGSPHLVVSIGHPVQNDWITVTVSAVLPAVNSVAHAVAQQLHVGLQVAAASMDRCC
jgi:hypothetical protein